MWIIKKVFLVDRTTSAYRRLSISLNVQIIICLVGLPKTCIFAVQLDRGVEQLVARRAHNPKVVGSSPASATNIPCN